MTSGLYNYNLTANDIIKEALLLCHAYDPNQTLEAEDRATGLRSLNLMVKAWQAQGYHLWTLEDAVIFCQAGKQSYSLGPTGDHACNADDFISTAIATAAVATDEVLVVDSSTGMSGAPDIFTSNQAADVNAWTATNANLSVASNELTIANSGAAAGYAELSLTGLTVGDSYRVTVGYEVGTSTSATFSIISDSVTLVTTTETANGTYTLDFTATQTTASLRVANVSTTSGHTTIINAANYVNKAGGDYVGIELDDGTRQWLNIVSISGATLSLSGAISGDAAIDKTVYTYSTKIQRPLRVRDGRFRSLVSSDEIPINKWGRSDYFAQTNKSDQGTVTNAYYDPNRGTNGTLYVWQTANDVRSLINMGYTQPIEYFDATSDTPDFPDEWGLALTYNLATVLAPQYNVDPNHLQMLKMLAQEYLDNALEFDDEDASIFVQPDFS